jgi:hypothetical protein
MNSLPPPPPVMFTAFSPQISQRLQQSRYGKLN